MYGEGYSNNLVLLDESSYAFCFPITGDNVNSTKFSPTSVVGGKRWQKMSLSTNAIVGLDESSFAWSWGSNNQGVLGDNTGVSNSVSPVSVVGGRQFVDICMLQGACYALDNSGFLWSWGNNGYGQLGDGTQLSRSSPVSVLGGKQWLTFSTRYLYNGNSSITCLDTSSYAWSWGYNNSGQLGDGTELSRSSPVSVIGDKIWRSLAYTTNNRIGIDSSSKLWCWGINNTGCVGDGTLQNRSSPTSVINQTTNFILCSMGVFGNVAVDSSSYLWQWGNTPLGNYSSIIAVRAQADPNTVTMGYQRNLYFVDNNGNSNFSGYGLNYNFGNNIVSDFSSPAVCFPFPFKKLVFNSSNYTSALTTNSELWVWGSSAYNGYKLQSKPTGSIIDEKIINYFGS
jgi:alpha-tubulin suppressor-like RCC1 family protein